MHRELGQAGHGSRPAALLGRGEALRAWALEQGRELAGLASVGGGHGLGWATREDGELGRSG